MRIGMAVCAVLAALGAAPALSAAPGKEVRVKLPPPRLESRVSTEDALRRRHSVREYRSEPLTLAEVAQLLWAAQGMAGRDDGRTAPSAGALYPLEVYLAAGEVGGLAPGLYRYQPRGHDLVRVGGEDVRGALAAAAYGQSWVRRAPAILVLTGVVARTAAKYGARAERYVQIEAGLAAENVFLQAVALGLGAVYVGAFDDDQVLKVLGLTDRETPLAILPVGKVK